MPSQFKADLKIKVLIEHSSEEYKGILSLPPLIQLTTVNISIEKMEALYTTHDELSHPLDRYKQSLRTEYGSTSEFWRVVGNGATQDTF